MSAAYGTDGLRAMLRDAAAERQLTLEQVAERYRTGRTAEDILTEDIEADDA